MCTRIVINNGDLPDVENQGQFKEHFGHYLLFPDDDWGDDSCLCGINLDTEFNMRNIPFMYDGGDYYINIPQ